MTVNKFNYSLSEDRGCMLDNNSLLFFLFLLTTQTHVNARILTLWSLLLMFRVSPEPGMLVCDSFSVHWGWFLIYPFKLSPKPASCPLCDPSSSSLLSSPLSLEFFCQSLGRAADALWQGTECVQDFMSVLFLV